MDLEYKQMLLSNGIEKGTFEGIACKYNNIDQANDRLLKSAGLNNNMKEIPILYQHDINNVIGQGVLTDGTEGIMLKAKLFLEKDEDGNMIFPLAWKAYELAKKGLMKLSIGYKVNSYSYKNESNKTVRELEDINVMETSMVLFPCNEKAVITDVKEEGGKEDMELKEKVESLEVKLNEITEMLKPQFEEKTISDKINEFKSYIDLETKAGKKLSKASKQKIKEALEMLKSMISDDEEMDKEEDKECYGPDRRRKENDEKLELKSDELEALENLYKTLKGEEK